MSSWFITLVPVGIGFLLGVAAPVRKPVVLLLPPVVLGVALWIKWGWFGDDYDIGRDGLVIVIGFFAGALVALWAVGVALGRYVRGLWRAGGL